MGWSADMGSPGSRHGGVRTMQSRQAFGAAAGHVLFVATAPTAPDLRRHGAPRGGRAATRPGRADRGRNSPSGGGPARRSPPFRTGGRRVAETITRGHRRQAGAVDGCRTRRRQLRPTGRSGGGLRRPAEDEADRSARIDRVVDFTAGSIARMAPFVPVIVQAADRDERMRACRGCGAGTPRDHSPAGLGGRRRSVCFDAVDEVYLLTRAETYLTLVEHRGWTTERYRDWLRRSILSRPPSRAERQGVKPARVGEVRVTTAQAGRDSSRAVAVRPRSATTNMPALCRVTSPGERVGSVPGSVRCPRRDRSPGTAAPTAVVPSVRTAATSRRPATSPTAGEAYVDHTPRTSRARRHVDPASRSTPSRPDPSTWCSHVVSAVAVRVGVEVTDPGRPGRRDRRPLSSGRTKVDPLRVTATSQVRPV